MNIVFHIGHYKTGTSAIQAFLKANRELLIKSGTLYPQVISSPNLSQHSLLVGDVIAGRSSDILGYLQYAADEARQHDCNRIIFSSEGFCSVDRASAMKLYDLASTFGEVQFVLYLRNVYDYALSQVFQLLKNPSRNLDFKLLSRRLARMLDYDRIIEAWSTRCGFPDVYVYEEIGNSAQHFIESVCELQGLAIPRQEVNRSIPIPLFLALLFSDCIRHHDDHERISKTLSATDYPALKTNNSNLILLAKFIVDAVGYSCDHPALRQKKTTLTMPPVHLKTASSEVNTYAILKKLGLLFGS